jgi:hypothetical protein
MFLCPVAVYVSTRRTWFTFHCVSVRWQRRHWSPGPGLLDVDVTRGGVKVVPFGMTQTPKQAPPLSDGMTVASGPYTPPWFAHVTFCRLYPFIVRRQAPFDHLRSMPCGHAVLGALSTQVSAVLLTLSTQTFVVVDQLLVPGATAVAQAPDVA